MGGTPHYRAATDCARGLAPRLAAGHAILRHAPARTRMTTATTFVILFCIATAVAVAVHRLEIPYTVALVIAGLGIGSLHIVSAPTLTQELLFAVFLPGLLFEAAFHIDASV